MLLHSLMILAGLALLALGSDRFVSAAAAIARNLGVTPMVIGLTVVALGTSAPEMLVSAVAAAGGNPGIALGNVLGSNVANITLVLGSSAMLAPLVVASKTVRREFPLLFAVTALAWLVAADERISRVDAGVLLLATVAVLWFIVHTAREVSVTDPLRREAEALAAAPMPMRRAVLLAAFGLVAMLVASKLLVLGASGIARAFGVSDLVIGLTVVAVGTSLPELAASVAGALKGEPDIAVGNVLGSNMFNLLPVLAIAGLVEPFPVEPDAQRRDFPVMAALTVALFLMCVGRRGPGRVTRVKGGILLAAFVAYQATLYLAAP